MKNRICVNFTSSLSFNRKHEDFTMYVVAKHEEHGAVTRTWTHRSTDVLFRLTEQFLVHMSDIWYPGHVEDVPRPNAIGYKQMVMFPPDPPF